MNELHVVSFENLEYFYFNDAEEQKRKITRWKLTSSFKSTYRTEKKKKVIC
jgi:hypothetical protein